VRAPDDVRTSHGIFAWSIGPAEVERLLRRLWPSYLAKVKRIADQRHGGNLSRVQTSWHHELKVALDREAEARRDFGRRCEKWRKQRRLSEELRRKRMPMLVEGPAWADAQFYGEWLLAAAKAQVFWRDALEDQQFARQIERLRIVYEPDFGIGATVMLMNLRRHLTTFVLDLASEEGEEFVMMVGMGFSVQSGHICRMTIPSALTSETVKNAVLAFAQNRR
jgi:hypothetical protein